jgi:hypothetical protein
MPRVESFTGYQRTPKRMFTWSQSVELEITIDPRVSAMWRSPKMFSDAVRGMFEYGGQAVFVIHSPQIGDVLGHHIPRDVMVFEMSLTDKWDRSYLRLCGEGDDVEGAGAETVFHEKEDDRAEIAAALACFVMKRLSEYKQPGTTWCAWSIPNGGV